MTTDLLQLEDLTISFAGNGDCERPVVTNAGLRLVKGETLALVGASGSGKTLLARSLAGLLPPGARIHSGSLSFNGNRYDLRQRAELQCLRGREICYVFQEPLSSLNPAVKVGVQLMEGHRFHSGNTAIECREIATGMLERVGIARPQAVMDKYPHELSGGMCQRVMIGAAALLRPALLIADEPTTALDSVIKDEVLLLMQQLAREAETSVLLITHDLATAAMVADNAAVMRQGAVIESAPMTELLRSPRHSYTRELLASTPAVRIPRSDETTVVAETSAAVRVRDVSVSFPGRGGTRTDALHRVSFEVASAEILCVIGESGSGKTTLSRVVAALQPPDSGEVFLREAPVGNRPFAGKQGLQFIFQDSAGSLDPRMTVAGIVSEGFRFRRGYTRARRREKAGEALRMVDLDAALLDRFPHQLSGGQRQRVNIARAIVMNPDVILADEPFSALDLTAQQQIIELFLRLRTQCGFACLFISHDLAVVEQLADRIGVLNRGVLLEIGPANAILNDSRHPYTRQLVTAGSRLVAEPAGGYRAMRRQSNSQHAALGVQPVDPGLLPAAIGYHRVGSRHFVAVCN